MSGKHLDSGTARRAELVLSSVFGPSRAVAPSGGGVGVVFGFPLRGRRTLAPMEVELIAGKDVVGLRLQRV